MLWQCLRAASTGCDHSHVTRFSLQKIFSKQSEYATDWYGGYTGIGK